MVERKEARVVAHFQSGSVDRPPIRDLREGLAATGGLCDNRKSPGSVNFLPRAIISSLCVQSAEKAQRSICTEEGGDPEGSAGALAWIRRAF
ncbi:hypothetical protein AAFF_G00201080 [Aldrovandia affinis]|uniref:Uncharacterized protein n=1 Tax=Aldrovandia affinis TaxID=143900 RepID=A0AAD7RI92_9TELE|nr:hypothetical protein AAFF_G00201080 [Aldrovandia affinis]